MQPLDVSMYGPFKTYHAAAMNSMMMKLGVPITIYDIEKLVNTAHQRAMTPSNIISGFRKTGIFPYDDGIFQNDDFAGSYASDRPDPIQSEALEHETEPQIAVDVDVDASQSTSEVSVASPSTTVAPLASTPTVVASLSSSLPPS